MDSIPLAPSQRSTCPSPGGLDFNNLHLSHLHGYTMFAADPLSQTLVIQELLPFPDVWALESAMGLSLAQSKKPLLPSATPITSCFPPD